MDFSSETCYIKKQKNQEQEGITYVWFNFWKYI